LPTGKPDYFISERIPPPAGDGQRRDMCSRTGTAPSRTGRGFGVFGRLVPLEGEAPDLAGRGVVGCEGSEASCSIEQAHPIANLKVCTWKL
jgi:hypothetical protein